MDKRIKKFTLYLIILLNILVLIVLYRLIKLYDICCFLFNIIVPILLGFAFAWALKPIYKKMNKKLNKRLSFFLLILITILIYVGLVIIIIPVIVNEGSKILELINSYIPKLKEIPYIKIDTENIKITPEAFLNSCGGIFSIIVNFALINMFGFYMLYNYDLISSLTKKRLPDKYKDVVLQFSRKFSTNMYLYIKGTLIDMSVLFIMVSIFFIAFKIKYAVLLALFIAITNVIPFIGPYIGGIPALLVGFSTSIKLGIITFSIILISQLIESNIINPLIMSKVTKINPLFIVIAITIMGAIGGIVGMALTIPTLIFIKILLEFIKKYKT